MIGRLVENTSLNNKGHDAKKEMEGAKKEKEIAIFFHEKDIFRDYFRIMAKGSARYVESSLSASPSQFPRPTMHIIVTLMRNSDSFGLLFKLKRKYFV